MFVSDTVRQTYEARHARYLTALNGGTPDRVPIRFLIQEAAARICGETNQAMAIDYGKAFDCTRRAGEILNCDAVMLNAIWSNYGLAKAASWRYLHVPGVDINLNSVMQFSEPRTEEEEFLHFDEYEEFIDDPTAFLVNKWMARNTTRVREKDEPVDFDHNAALMAGALAYANYMNAFGPAADKLKYESGLVSANAGMIKAPLEILMDKFRGYVNLASDCFEEPKLVMRACEALIPHIVANAINGADPNKEVPITIWAHRGCLPFITREVFDGICWPTLRIVFEEIISRGYQILFYGEGNWEAHYDDLRTLPAGSIVYHLDKGSKEYAARKLKDRFAISGGLNYNKLVYGTRDDIRQEMKELFNWFKPDGGYMLDATALMLSDVNPDNLKTAVQYVMDHGGYSRTVAPKPRETCPGHAIDGGSRPPQAVRPWDEEKKGYRMLAGDVEGTRAAWEKVDSALYNYLWTTVLW